MTEVPLRVPPGYPGICTCPIHHAPCAGPEISYTEPPTSWPLTSEAVWPQGRRSPSHDLPGNHVARRGG